jgi:antitoxin FitA
MKPEQQAGASTTFQVAVSEDSARRLEELAGAAGMSLEQFLRASVEEWLSHPRPGPSDAASYILSKNAELNSRII